MSNKQNDILFDIVEEGIVNFNCEKCNKSGSSQDTLGWKKISDLRRVSGYYMLCPDCENPITIANITISVKIFADWCNVNILSGSNKQKFSDALAYNDIARIQSYLRKSILDEVRLEVSRMPIAVVGNSAKTIDQVIGVIIDLRNK